jgi:hypothetical protein
MPMVVGAFSFVFIRCALDAFVWFFIRTSSACTPTSGGGCRLQG